MTTAEWRFDYVLPNLQLPAPDPATNAMPQPGDWSGGIDLGSEFIALVPHSDLRLNTLRATSPELKKLLDAFRTLAGHRHSPAAIIVREDAPDVVRTDMECLIAFRNSVTFTFILRARAALAAGSSHAEPTWSDTFELHPTMVGPRGHLVTRSEALVAVFSTETKYLATHSPHVSPCGRRLWSDAYVYRALSQMWHRRYLRDEKSIYAAALFRALEVAFVASSVATKNQGSLSDYGTQLALWVSALEILAWPRAHHADLDAVLQLLDQYEWASARLRERRYFVTRKRNTIELTPVQYACALMYDARNAFLHGNPVSAEMLVPGSLSRSLSLPQIASTVFRTALAAYLQVEVPMADVDDEELGPEWFSSHDYSRALKVSFGLERRTPVDA